MQYTVRTLWNDIKPQIVWVPLTTNYSTVCLYDCFPTNAAIPSVLIRQLLWHLFHNYTLVTIIRSPQTCLAYFLSYCGARCRPSRRSSLNSHLTNPLDIIHIAAIPHRHVDLLDKFSKDTLWCRSHRQGP